MTRATPKILRHDKAAHELRRAYEIARLASSNLPPNARLIAG